MKTDLDRYFHRAIVSGRHADYDRALRNLDKCIEIMRERTGTDVDYRLAPYYVKLGKCLLRMLTNPLAAVDGRDGAGEDVCGEACGRDGEDGCAHACACAHEEPAAKHACSDSEPSAGGLPAPGDEERSTPSTSSDTSSGTSSGASPEASSDASSDTAEHGPYEAIMEYLTLGLECLETAPRRLRLSRALLDTEADLYTTVGELRAHFRRPGALEAFTQAITIYMQNYAVDSQEVCQIRFHIGNYYLREKQYALAVVEYAACRRSLAAQEDGLRRDIRGLIASERAAGRRPSAGRRRDRDRVAGLAARKHELRKQLHLVKAQLAEVVSLDNFCARLLDAFGYVLGGEDAGEGEGEDEESSEAQDASVSDAGAAPEEAAPCGSGAPGAP